MTSNLHRVIFPVTTAVEASPADIWTWIIEHPIRVRDFGVIVSVLTAIDTTDAVVSIDAVIAGAARAEKGTCTITDAVAVGTEVVASEDFTTWASFELSEGDTLYIEHKIAGADAGVEAGDYYAVLYYEPIPDGEA